MTEKHTEDVHIDPHAVEEHHGEVPQAPHAELVNAPMVIGVGVGLFLLIVVTTLIIFQYYQWYSINLLEARGQATYNESPMRERRERLQGQLDDTGWVDAEAGIIHIPVDLAGSKVVDAYAGISR